jgi:hypothetical protein
MQEKNKSYPQKRRKWKLIHANFTRISKPEWDLLVFGGCLRWEEKRAGEECVKIKMFSQSVLFISRSYFIALFSGKLE